MSEQRAAVKIHFIEIIPGSRCFLGFLCSLLGGHGNANEVSRNREAEVNFCSSSNIIILIEAFSSAASFLFVFEIGRRRIAIGSFSDRAAPK